MNRFKIDHFTVVSLASQPLSEREAKVDLDLIQSPFIMEIMLKNSSLQKKNMIYIIKQEGLYQNKVNSSLVSTCNCNMAYCTP